MLYRIRRNKLLIILIIAAVAVFAAWQGGYIQKAVDWSEQYIFTTKEKLASIDKLFFGPEDGPGQTGDTDPPPTQKTGELEVHFIDVGNADAILIICDGEAGLVDAGENNQGGEVVSYLKEHGVSALDYVVGTHPHSDHIGGLDTVLYSIPTKTVLMPAGNYTTQTYFDVLDAIETTGAESVFPEVGYTFYLGAASVTVLSPDREWEEANDNSIVLLIENGEDSFILTGDAGTGPEGVMLDAGLVPEADVLKVGHHGSNTASGYRWLNAVMPDYCVIPCGEGNEYGHPHEKVMSRLDDLARVKGTITFRSDIDGTIVAYSAGDDHIRFETEK